MANHDLLQKKMVSSCSILSNDKDMVTEIALHLSLQSLFRCRAVCKLWRDVIDSPSFQKLHTLSNHNNNEDETVYLTVQLSYDDFKFLGDADVVKMSINKLKSSKFLILVFNESSFRRTMPSWDILRFSRAVKGLICFNINSIKGKPLAICNPFLGQIKILANSSNYNSCERFIRDVGIGCDGEFYKVVEVAYCREHRLSHARLYSRRADSWRDLGLDEPMCIIKPVHLSCNDGHFAHWHGRWTSSGYNVILTFDMKNEVFRVTKMPPEDSDWDSDSLPDYQINYDRDKIVAKDDGCSFTRIVFPDKSDGLVMIYESLISICDEEKGTWKLSWYFSAGLEQPPPTHFLPLWRRDCVIVKIYDADKKIKRFFYDYRARRFIRCLNLPAYSEFLDYKGTFISP